MGCKQCSHLLGQEGGNNPHSNSGDGYDSGHEGTNEDGEYNERQRGGNRHGFGKGRGHHINYSSDNPPHGNNLTDISEESSSACQTSQQTS